MNQADPKGYFIGGIAELERDRAWEPPAGQAAHLAMRGAREARRKAGVVVPGAMLSRLDALIVVPAPRREPADHSKRPVRDLWTGIDYPNPRAAADATFKDYVGICQCCVRNERGRASRFAFGDAMNHIATRPGRPRLPYSEVTP